MVGFRTALSWMTIIPVKAPDEVDRALGVRTVPVSYTHLTLPTT